MISNEPADLRCHFRMQIGIQDPFRRNAVASVQKNSELRGVEPPQLKGCITHCMFENRDRPAWVNWLFLAIFLWSSWQLAGFWFEQLHG